MIEFPVIWLLFPITLIIVILASWLLTRAGALENRVVRTTFVVAGAALGFLSLVLPFFQQPRFQSIIVNYVVGIPVAVIGLVGRVYPMIYLRRKGTTTVLDDVARVVDTGPYGIVRHPQYASGVLLVGGWFLIWGGVYCLCLLPLTTALIVVQAVIEERHILAKKFGEAYGEYRGRVGMLFPRIARKRHE